MKDEILIELQKPFKLKARKGLGGQTFHYVPSDDVVERMNKIFKGNWSTEVLSITEKEGHVLAHVRVSVLDTETKTMFYHEGFAGQYIARYTEGPRRGQVIDIGNSYKAAISKAIKVACSRWGVGLRLDPELSESEPNDLNVPEIISQNPDQLEVPSPQQIDTSGTSVDIPDFNTSTTSHSDTLVTANDLQSPSVDFNPESHIVSKDNFEMPNTPEVPLEAVSKTNQQNDVSQEEVQVDPLPANSSVLPDIPENVAESFDVPFDMEPATLTAVQETAITILMEQYGFSYEELAKKALERDTFPPLKELTYKDAVKILQYGNNLK